MYVLAIDTSCAVSTVAITNDDRLLAEITLNLGNTHSETLLPSIDSILNMTSLKISDIDRFAVTVGPGSFTGVRIGVSTVKGLAFDKGNVCCGVSSLEALAENCPKDSVICTVINARHSTAYAAFFRKTHHSLERITDDDVMPLDQIAAKIAQFTSPVFLAGDCCELLADSLTDSSSAVIIPKAHIPSAYYVALSALHSDKVCTADELNPVYLRKSQAERERNERLQNTNSN